MTKEEAWGMNNLIRLAPKLGVETKNAFEMINKEIVISKNRIAPKR